MPYRLTVIGTGYLGITHAACMADLGFDVLGLDIDADKIDRLNNGELPIHEPGLEPVLRRGLDSGRLRFTTSYEEVATRCGKDARGRSAPPPPRTTPSRVEGREQPTARRPCRGEA